MTTEPRTELRAEPGQVWLPARRAPAYPAGPALEAAPYGRHRRAPEQRSSYREVFAIAEFRSLWTAQVLSFAGGQFAQVAISAFIVTAGVRARPLPDRDQASRPSLWAVSADGIRIVFGSRTLLTLLLFGWLAGFYIVPEGLAAPYAHSLDSSTLTVGLLMAAMPAGIVAGAFLLGRMATPSTRMRMMGWLAILSCIPLIGSAWSPPLWAVLLLWALAGVGGAYQLAAAAAFVQALQPATRARPFGLAQSGLYAVQGLSILVGGAVAEAIGAPWPGWSG